MLVSRHLRFTKLSGVCIGTTLGVVLTLIILFVVLHHSACNQEVNNAPLTRFTWPTTLLGRSLQSSTNKDAFYASTKEGAASLQRTIQKEHDMFARQYAASCSRRLVVIAIEGGFPEKEQIESLWHRPRYLFRPYTLTENAYYREPICLSTLEARSLIPDISEPEETLVCFVGTEEDFAKAFESEVAKYWTKHEENLAKIPAEKRQASMLEIGALRFAASIAFERMRDLDADLLTLRRREVLWLSWLECGFAADSERLREEKMKLEEHIKSEWFQTYSKKPRS